MALSGFNAKKTAMPFFFSFLNLIWMLRVLDTPSQEVLLLLCLTPSTKGMGSATVPGREPHPLAAAAELSEKPGLPSLPAAVRASFPQQPVWGQVPADTPWAEPLSHAGWEPWGDPRGARPPLAPQGRASEGPWQSLSSTRRKTGIFRWADRA